MKKDARIGRLFIMVILCLCVWIQWGFRWPWDPVPKQEKKVSSPASQKSEMEVTVPNIPKTPLPSMESKETEDELYRNKIRMPGREYSAESLISGGAGEGIEDEKGRADSILNSRPVRVTEDLQRVTETSKVMRKQLRDDAAVIARIQQQAETHERILRQMRESSAPGNSKQ